MKIVKLRLLNKRKERVEAQLAELETNILIIKANDGEYIENEMLRKRLIKQLEEIAKIKNEMEELIEHQTSLLDREILSRRFRGQTYKKIARELDISFNLVRKILEKFYKNGKSLKK